MSLELARKIMHTIIRLNVRVLTYDRLKVVHVCEAETCGSCLAMSPPTNTASK